MSIDEALADEILLEHTCSEASSLRAELKQWEKAFASANGRKAERDDIKKDQVISQKYKEYSKLRSKKLKKASQRNSFSPPRESRKGTLDGESSIAKTPKRPRQAAVHPADIDPYDPPLTSTPVATRTFVGPTPQKNGQILGLFDLLSPSRAKDSPLKAVPSTQVLLETECTPSKPRHNNIVENLVTTPSKNHESSPQLAKAVLDPRYSTPSTHRFRRQNTSAIIQLNNDETPEFLRRATRRILPNCDADDMREDGHTQLSLSPVAVRMPPKPAGTGLSALVKGLRNMEEDRLDEEMDLLNELEQEDEPIKASRMADVEVEDSQNFPATELPLGPDREVETSEDEDLTKEGLDRNGNPLKVWKKRGQKRTTRKVNIKPTVSKWKPEPGWDPHGVSKQRLQSETKGESSQYHDHEVATGTSQVDDISRKKGLTQRKARKTASNANANANFRALKIQKRGTKFKGRGRFGRR